jgi:hypothetical protein
MTCARLTGTPGGTSVFRAFRTGFRAAFRVWHHLVIPAAAVVSSCFLSGDLAPARRALMDLLPFTAPGWLGLGFIAAGVLRGPAAGLLRGAGQGFPAGDDSRRLPRDIECGREADGITPARVTTFQDGTAGWNRHGSREDLTA